MTIRARLSLWYAAVMFVALLAMGVLSYYQFVIKPRSGPELEAAEDESDFGEVMQIVLWCGVPAAALALAGGWWLMRQSLEPVALLTRATEKITEYNLKDRLPRSGNGDELDRLTEVFNGMLARLDGSFARVRDFTLHASHELKTPVTVLCGQAETALRETGLTSAQRDLLAGQLQELRRLSRIVDSLTLLTKADAGLLPLALVPVRLGELVRDCFEDAQILAHTSGLRVELAACDELTVAGDSHRLRQLLLNLADNAVKYNQPRGHVTMSLCRENEAAEFMIANTGPGIPPEILPRVFDRFLRGDAAHTCEVEGCGLGLSIAQWIVRAHHGTIEIKSVPLQATIVTVRLPLAAGT